jgi:two-component sensor histidine kinase
MSLELVLGSKSVAVDLVAEANHRIANHLSVISGLVRMQAASLGKEPSQFSGDQIRLILAETGSRLETVARLHRLLAEGRKKGAVDVADYLREIAEALVSGLAGASKTVLRFSADDACLVSKERALPLGLIVGELVTNAIKYAHPAGVEGAIEISCRRGPNGAVVVRIADDGVGLPDGFDTTKGGSMGFRVMRSLAEQLAARMTFESDDLGLSVTVHMPALAELNSAH